jgi:4-hydroxy-2-oxoheptanedioate aldolase
VFTDELWSPNRQVRPVARRTDKVSWGVHLSFFSPELIELCGALGFEWLFLDAQHTPLNSFVCRDLVRAADLAEMFCLVRVPEISATAIEGFLDAGVVGILAPNISSPEQARDLVAAVKYSPYGSRGAGFLSRAARYGLISSASEYCRASNCATFTAALIETQKGIDTLEAIAAVPGLDYLAIGASDLRLSLERDTKMTEGELGTIVREATFRVKATGKPQICVVSDAAEASRAAAYGAQLIAVPDAALVARAGRAFLESLVNERKSA